MTRASAGIGVRQQRFPIHRLFEPTISAVCEIGALQRPKIRLDLPSI
jgi:hypothetical protein